jgi:hypothetical protein
MLSPPLMQMKLHAVRGAFTAWQADHQQHLIPALPPPSVCRVAIEVSDPVCKNGGYLRAENKTVQQLCLGPACPAAFTSAQTCEVLACLPVACRMSPQSAVTASAHLSGRALIAPVREHRRGVRDGTVTCHQRYHWHMPLEIPHAGPLSRTPCSLALASVVL